METENSGGNLAGFLRTRSGIVLLGFLAVAGFFLITEHTAHVLGALPYLLVGGCLLMHMFMHAGHGGQMQHHADHGGTESKGDSDS